MGPSANDPSAPQPLVVELREHAISSQSDKRGSQNLDCRRRVVADVEMLATQSVARYNQRVWQNKTPADPATAHVNRDLSLRGEAMVPFRYLTDTTA